MAQVDNEDRFDVDTQLDQAQTKDTQEKPRSGGGILTRWWFWLIIIILIAGGAYGYTTGFSFDGLKSVSPGGGGAIAVVNGEEITQDDLDARVAQAQLNGQNGEVDQAQLVETMINTELILQDAAAQGITASDEEVENYYQNQVLGEQTTEEQLKQQLSQSNFTIADLKNDIHDQLVIQKYIEANASSADISDQQVQEYYDQLKAQQGEDTENFPELAQVEAQIKQQLQAQQQSQQVNQILQQLRADADIQNNYSAEAGGGNGNS